MLDIKWEYVSFAEAYFEIFLSFTYRFINFAAKISFFQDFLQTNKFYRHLGHGFALGLTTRSQWSPGSAVPFHFSVLKCSAHFQWCWSLWRFFWTLVYIYIYTPCKLTPYLRCVYRQASTYLYFWDLPRHCLTFSSSYCTVKTGSNRKGIDRCISTRLGAKYSTYFPHTDWCWT